MDQTKKAGIGPLTVAIVMVLVACGSRATSQPRTPGLATATSGRAAAPAQTVPQTAAPERAAAPEVDVRRQIQEAVDRAPVSGKDQVDAYLDTLEAQARRIGMVTALEMEPGVQIILRYYGGSPDKLVAFVTRMARVQEELLGPRQISERLEDSKPKGSM